MLIEKIAKNPLRIIVATIATCLLIAIVGAPIADIGHSGGEAVGITFFAVMIAATWYIVPAVAIITLFFYREWAKKNWYKNAIIIVLCGLVVTADITDRNEDKYGYESELITINGVEWRKNTETYDSEKIRSISFLLNDKKTAPGRPIMRTAAY